MEREFVPYELAVKLKELGFDEECLAGYKKELLTDDGRVLNNTFIIYGGSVNYNIGDEVISAPLKQQAFKWFREKQGLIYNIGHIGHTNTWAYEIINMRIAGPNYGYGETYEEAELACLVKLIEIVKK